MMKRAVVAFVAIACASCGDSPTTPTRIASTPSANKASASVNSVFDPKQLGHAVLDGKPYTVGVRELPGVCYQRDFFTYKGAPLFIVWNAADRINQVDAGHDPDNGERFTLSDFANGPIAADEHLWCIPGAPPAGPPVQPLPPVPPAPPTPPVPPPAPPLCSGGQTFTFPLGSYIAQFPTGWPMPWYPSARGPYLFTVPAGTWRLSAETGDEHLLKQDGTQAHEIGAFVFDGGGPAVTVGPTNDIADDSDTAHTDFDVVTFAHATAVLRFVHAGPVNPPEPTDSFYPVSFTYACPVVALR